MDWNEFSWAATIAAIVLSIIWGITIYQMHLVDAKVEALKTGMTPMEVVCAFEDISGDNPSCVLQAAK